MSNQPMTQPDKKKGLSKKFIWFHATSVNGTAMAIAATLATYFSLYVQLIYRCCIHKSIGN